MRSALKVLKERDLEKLLVKFSVQEFVQEDYDVGVTPSPVTERVCKTCAFGHAEFNSRDTYQFRPCSSLVERRFEESRVGCSIQPLDTI